MKKLIFPFLLLAAVLAALASPGSGDSDPPPPPKTSALWGESGELWNPATSRLKDFTSAGYMSGNVPIPDWPVGVDVTDPQFGAIPNDDLDDSQAFIAAVAACPPNHAVFVPNGKYIMLQRVVLNRDYIVVRGEDMFQTVLFYPKYTNEVYINEVGFDPANPSKRNTGVDPFFLIPGGTHRSIENLTFEFREQIKMGHWEHKGNDAIRHAGTHSWLRNLYVKNADHAIATGGGRYLSLVNIIFDQYSGRDKVTTELEGSVVGHMAINLNDSSNNLYHNILLTDNWSHEFDEKSNSGNVISSVRSEVGVIAYHGQGSVGNLYTDLEIGSNSATGMGNSVNQRQETYWNVYSRNGSLSTTDVEFPYNTVGEGNDHVFVGYGIDPAVFPTKITTENGTSDNFWYEAIAPSALQPKNIYLAQMAYRNKPVPPSPPMVLPNPYTGDVIRIEPVEDNGVSSSNPDTVTNPLAISLPVTSNPYFKFDLTGLDLASVHRVRLRVTSRSLINTPVEFAAYSAANDLWTAATLTFNNRPLPVVALDSVQVNENSKATTLEFDVTSFVQAQLAGDKVVSLMIGKLSGNGFLSSFNSSEDGFGPELIIEQVPSAVPGAPSAPSSVRSSSMIGNIVLDWEDNPEADVVSYNVYRSTGASALTQYGFPIGMGLTTSDFVDIQSQHDQGWDVGMVRNDLPYFYRVTAVDKHGYESESSLEIVGTAIGTANNTLPPVFVSGPLVMPNATQYLSYSGTLAGLATDPESDPMYFSKIDGPKWLSIATNGTLSGTPRHGDNGTFQFNVQVNSLGGGRDEAIVQITVNPGPPDAPVGLGAVPGAASVQLDWSHGSEGSAGFTFKVSRSMVAGGPYTEVASGLTASNYTDSGLSNGTTYYYVVTANNSSGGSPPSVEVSATPVAGLAIMTNFLGGVLSVSTNWDAGLPVGKWGRVNVDATADTTVTLNAWSVLHTGGSLLQSGTGALRLDTGTTWITEGPAATTSTGFRGFTVAGGSSFTLRRGTIKTESGKDWSVTGTNSVITVHGGTINLGRSLLLSSSGRLVVNGGVINGVQGVGDIGVSSIATGTLNFNGGTTTIHRIGLAGSNSTLNLGGSTTGSVTATAFTATFGSNSVINFLPGSRMSLRISGADEWAAALWAAADLTYNGQGLASLGSWTSVIAPNGLGPGVRFDYDSATETLRLLVNPDSDGDGIDDSWEVLNFGSAQAINGSIDSDGDGALDFFEYLFGSNPKSAASMGFQVRAEAGPAGNSKIFRWEVLQRFVLGTDYKASISTNLGNWNLLQSGDYQLSQDVLGGKTQVELRLTVDPGPKAFLRLQQP